MPLRRGEDDAAIHPASGDRLQLFAMPPQWGAVGLFRVRHREYIWGDKTLRTIRCKTCGCVTHWEPLDPAPGAKHGINLGNFDPALIASVRVRKFDGANTWRFFDEMDVHLPATDA
jgi:hypothetical protein